MKDCILSVKDISGHMALTRSPGLLWALNHSDKCGVERMFRGSAHWAAAEIWRLAARKAAAPINDHAFRLSLPLRKDPRS